LVIISPADRDLIVEGSETRRNSWIASSLSWTPIPATNTIPKSIKSTQCFTKIFCFESRFLKTTPSLYNEQLDGYGKLFSKKNSYLNSFLFLIHITMRSPDQETVQVVYESHLFENNYTLQEKTSIKTERYIIPVWALTKTTSHLKSMVTIKNLVLRDSRSLS
jgi:DNA replication and repair protein RecF